VEENQNIKGMSFLTTEIFLLKNFVIATKIVTFVSKFNE